MKIKGTIKQLIEQGVSVNGVRLDAAMLSVLVRCNIGKVVGLGEKPTRGKTPNIYEFEANETITFDKD